MYAINISTLLCFSAVFDLHSISSFFFILYYYSKLEDLQEFTIYYQHNINILKKRWRIKHNAIVYT